MRLSKSDFKVYDLSLHTSKSISPHWHLSALRSKCLHKCLLLYAYIPATPDINDDNDWLLVIFQSWC